MEYIIEIIEPTNNPGNYITKLVYTDKKVAEETFNKLLEGCAEVEEVPSTEWDDRGPNWKNLRTVKVCDDDEEGYLITLDEIDTEKAFS